MNPTSKDRKLVFLAGSFFPREGGAERQLRHVLGNLGSDGWDVHVITRGLRGSPTYELREGIQIHRILVPSLRFESLNRLDGLFFFIRGVRAVRELDPAVVLSTQLGSSSLIGMIAAMGRETRRIVRLTGGGSTKFASESEAKASRPFGRLILAALRLNEYDLVSPAHHLLADFQRYSELRGDAVVIPNGICVASLVRQPDLQVAWYSRSGTQRSTEIFRALTERMEDVQFTSFGASAGFQSQNLNQAGWVDKPEELIARHRILLNTSPQEGMPNTVLQAIGSGVRVVAFSNDGMNEVAREFPSHVELVQSGEIQELEDTVRSALKKSRLKPGKVPDYDEVTQMWQSLFSEGERDLRY